MRIHEITDLLLESEWDAKDAATSLPARFVNTAASFLPVFSQYRKEYMAWLQASSDALWRVKRRDGRVTYHDSREEAEAASGGSETAKISRIIDAAPPASAGKWLQDNFYQGRKRISVSDDLVALKRAYPENKQIQELCARALSSEMTSQKLPGQEKTMTGSAIFIEVMKIIGQLIPVVMNLRGFSEYRERLKSLQQQYAQAVQQAIDLKSSPKSTKKPKAEPEDDSDKLLGRQNDEANKAFNAVLSSLPYAQRVELRTQGQKVPIQNRLAWLMGKLANK